MALIKLRNNTTGHEITVDENSPIVPVYTQQRGYVQVGSGSTAETKTAPERTTTTATTGGSTGSSTDKVTIYDWNGNPQQVLRADVNYWLSQGYSSSPPSAPAPSQPKQSTGKNPYAPGSEEYDRWEAEFGTGAGTGAGEGAGTGTSDGNLVTDFSGLPESITGGEFWASLTDQQKSIVATVYQGMVGGSQASAADAAAALEKAKELSDPYFKGLIALAQDELIRKTGSVEADFQSKVSTLQRRIQEINSDLTFNREFLSLEQQADLAALQRQYEMQLEDTQTQMQEAGLVFSSPREKAEARLNTAYQETAESSRRRYGARQRELEQQAARGLADINQQQTDLSRQTQETKTDLARRAEAALGTGNLPGGTQTLGTPVTGDIEAERQRSILELENQLRQRGSQPLPL